MNAVTARTVRDDLRSHLRCEAVIAVLVTADTPAGNSEFPRESDPFMTARAGLSGHGRRSIGTRLLDWRCNSMYAMTISANWRARHATRHGLSMYALHELCTLGFVALATRGRDVDFGNRRLRVDGWKDVVAVMTVSTDSSGRIALRKGFRVYALSI